MPLIVYGIAGSSPCLAVLLAARVLEIELELKIVDMKAGTQQHKSEAFLEMNPAHCVPTLDDDGFYIWESRAIITYLSDKYGKDDKLYPKDLKLRAVIDNMLYFDNGCLYAGLAGYIFPQVLGGKEPDSSRLDFVRDKLTILNEILGRKPYTAGNHLSLADISIACSLIVPEVFHSAGVDIAAYSNISKWLTRVRSELVFYDDVTKEGVAQLRSFIGKRMLR